MTGEGCLPGPVAASGHASGVEVDVLVRPEAIGLRRAVEDEAVPAITGRVLASRLLGRTSLVHFQVEIGGAEPLHLHARVPGRFLPRPDERVGVALDSTQAFVFAPGST